MMLPQFFAALFFLKLISSAQWNKSYVYQTTIKTGNEVPWHISSNIFINFDEKFTGRLSNVSINSLSTDYSPIDFQFSVTSDSEITLYPKNTTLVMYNIAKGFINNFYSEARNVSFGDGISLYKPTLMGRCLVHNFRQEADILKKHTYLTWCNSAPYKFDGVDIFDAALPNLFREIRSVTNYETGSDVINNVETVETIKYGKTFEQLRITALLSTINYTIDDQISPEIIKGSDIFKTSIASNDWFVPLVLDKFCDSVLLLASEMSVVFEYDVHNGILERQMLIRHLLKHTVRERREFTKCFKRVSNEYRTRGIEIVHRMKMILTMNFLEQGTINSLQFLNFLVIEEEDFLSEIDIAKIPDSALIESLNHEYVESFYQICKKIMSRNLPEIVKHNSLVSFSLIVRKAYGINRSPELETSMNNKYFKFLNPLHKINHEQSELYAYVRAFSNLPHPNIFNVIRKVVTKISEHLDSSLYQILYVLCLDKAAEDFPETTYTSLIQFFNENNTMGMKIAIAQIIFKTDEATPEDIMEMLKKSQNQTEVRDAIQHMINLCAYSISYGTNMALKCRTLAPMSFDPRIKKIFASLRQVVELEYIRVEKENVDSKKVNLIFPDSEFTVAYMNFPEGRFLGLMESEYGQRIIVGKNFNINQFLKNGFHSFLFSSINAISFLTISGFPFTLSKASVSFNDHECWDHEERCIEGTNFFGSNRSQMSGLLTYKDQIKLYVTDNICYKDMVVGVDKYWRYLLPISFHENGNYLLNSSNKFYLQNSTEINKLLTFKSTRIIATQDCFPVTSIILKNQTSEKLGKIIETSTLNLLDFIDIGIGAKANFIFEKGFENILEKSPNRSFNYVLENPFKEFEFFYLGNETKTKHVDYDISSISSSVQLSILKAVSGNFMDEHSFYPNRWCKATKTSFDFFLNGEKKNNVTVDFYYGPIDGTKIYFFMVYLTRNYFHTVQNEICFDSIISNEKEKSSYFAKLIFGQNCTSGTRFDFAFEFNTKKSDPKSYEISPVNLTHTEDIFQVDYILCKVMQILDLKFVPMPNCKS